MANTDPVADAAAGGEGDLDALWQQFHDAVNMTSRELEDWLRTDAAGESAESYPDRAGDPDSREVVRVLGKRRTDVTPEDAAVMRYVVDVVRAERGEDPEPVAGDAAWRHRLMSLGHDPLKPTA
jgi:hypothetical protein